MTWVAPRDGGYHAKDDGRDGRDGRLPPDGPGSTSRRGSETRQRTRQVGVRLTPDEFTALTAAADEAGESLAAYLRRVALGRRPTA